MKAAVLYGFVTLGKLFSSLFLSFPTYKMGVMIVYALKACFEDQMRSCIAGAETGASRRVSPVEVLIHA